MTPWLLRESRAELPHRHFDVAGAGSITGGLMLLVYAITRATGRGWGESATIALLVASAALMLESKPAQPAPELTADAALELEAAA